MMTSGEQQATHANAYRQVLVRAWTDEAFKRRLLTDPAAVLKEYGIDVPEGKKVHVHEASARVLHLILPAKPSELTEEQLEAIAGGNFGVLPPGINSARIYAGLAAELGGGH